MESPTSEETGYLQPHPGILGLREARQATIAHALQRTQEGPLPRLERLELVARFLSTLLTLNTWPASLGRAPTSANLPFEALAWLCWFDGFLRTPPTPDRLRDLRRLLARRRARLG